MLDYIFFDLDGTLTDPAEGITNSVAYALERFGITVKNKSDLNCFIGPPLKESFQRYFDLNEEQSKKAVSIYREYFSVKGIFENKLYDGIDAMLRTIVDNGKRPVLATSKPEVFAQKILDHFDIKKYFTCVSGSLLDGTRIDKHDVIEHAMSLLNIDCRDNCIMVGDRMHDVIGAKKSNMKVIGVEYGYGSYTELQTNGADYTVKNVAELEQLLLTL
jgi:phosphoglycolate phosphatase